MNLQGKRRMVWKIGKNRGPEKSRFYCTHSRFPVQYYTSAPWFSSSDSSADTAESFCVLLGCVDPPHVAVVISALIILTPNPSSMSPLLPLLTEYVPPSDKSSSPAFFRFSKNFCFRFFSFSSCSSLWRLNSDQTNALGRAVIKKLSF